MDLRKITDDFAVAPQILPEDVAEIAKSGYRSIICNRPDNEEYGQCDHCDVETEARKAGMEFLMLPIVSGVVTEEAADRFRQALDQMPRPILAYCRSGTRCTMLWTIANFNRLDPVEIVERTEQAGYDMRGIISQLQSMQGA